MKRLTLALIMLLLLLNCTPSSYSQKDFNAIPTAIAGVTLPTVEPQYRNPWTQELESQFQQRAADIILHYANRREYGNLAGENEKRAYPRAMFDFLAGNRERAIAFLQAEDPQAREHQHTAGIDFYYCFTLKGQIRKYFLFGSFLDPAYRKRMFDGAKQWTQEDPLMRPHPLYGLGEGTGQDWSIRRRGRWVDGRNTDNLRAMRETSVYLMAEETGNEATRQLYKLKIHRYVRTLYHIGMGEWDSSVYHSHTFASYLNLYDFAKDPEVKQLAKAALDWMSAAAAVKYYRGGWGGPVKRDYGKGNVAMKATAAQTFWLYFGDTPLPNLNPDEDTLQMITSPYRPPLAVVALAQRNFAKPVEILSSKPLYENWKPGNDRSPGYWETQYIGQTYQMGSLAGTFADGDVAPFKLLAYHSRRGVDYFVANTGKSWLQPGKMPEDEIGQFRNLLIWLRPASNASFFWQIPKTVSMEVEKGVWFFRFEKTWLAVHPIHLSPYAEVTTDNRQWLQSYPQERILKSSINGNHFAGFGLEVGEEGIKDNYRQFKRHVLQNSRLNLQQLAEGTVTLRGSNGDRLQLTYHRDNLLPILVKNEQVYDWSQHFALYSSQRRDQTPLDLGWKQGKLTVKAGGYQFVVAL